MTPTELEISLSLVLIGSKTSSRTTRPSSSWERTNALWTALSDSLVASSSLSSQRQITAEGTRMRERCSKLRNNTSWSLKWFTHWIIPNRIGWPIRTTSVRQLHRNGRLKVKGNLPTTEDWWITYNYMLVIDTIRKRNQSMIEFLASEVVCKALLDLFDLVNPSCVRHVYCRLEHSTTLYRLKTFQIYHCVWLRNNQFWPLVSVEVATTASPDDATKTVAYR